MGPPALVPRQRHLSKSLAHCREGEPNSGRPVQGGPDPNGVVLTGNHLPEHVPPVRNSEHRLVRFGDQRQAPSLLHANLPPQTMGVGRVLNQLGRDGGVRLSPPLPHTESAAQTEPSPDKATSNRALLAEKTVVPDSPRSPSRNPTQSSRLTPLSELGPGLSQSTSPTVAEPDCVAVVRARFRASGFSSDPTAMAASARRPSTNHTYNSRLARFFEWCSHLQIRPDTTSPSQLADFFMLLFEEGKQPNTIRNYRSAIGTIHSGFPDGSAVGTCPELSALLKCMANRRPIRRKLPPAWSINGVPHHLACSPFEPMGSSLLRDFTIKTLFLVAAASARRRSCLHALSTAQGHIRFDSRGVRLVPDPRFLTKNQTLAFIPGDIFLPKLSLASDTAEAKLWCLVRALKWYLHRTKDLRFSQALFILPTSPHSAASKETISRWLVQAIRLHAETDQPIRAHDIRGLAASKALFQGVPVDDILRAASWKTPSTFVASYLTDTVASELTFGRAVLGVPAGRSRPLGLPPL
ncbi:uncharacterized protein [Apostichopus japonicus]|uniref:uncharacterized protein n=1 Tax=Stichopus japonicus TaxID=307972 RepID=UPI003AB33360